jgi:hypothetical protein
MKIFRRVLIAFWIAFIALIAFLFLPPYPPPGTAGIKVFLFRCVWALATPLALGTIAYPIIHRNRTGMSRRSDMASPPR